MNLNAFQTALELVVSEQEILRANLVIEDDNLSLQIQEIVEPKIHFIEQDASIDSEEVKAITKKMTHQAFSLENSLLFRVSVIKGNDGFLCIICAHHIIVDGVSIGIFQEKLINYYQKIQSNKMFSFNFDQGYTQFILDENQRLKFGQYERQKDFWHEKIKEMSPVELRTDFKKQDSNNQESKEIAFKISEELFKQIQEKCKTLEITVFQFFFTSFYLLLHKQTNQKNITLTTPFSHRTSFDLLETIGCFIYTLPISLIFDEKSSFDSLAKELYAEMLQCYKNLGYPNNLIARKQKATLEGPSIFDFSFVSDFFEEQEYDQLTIHNVFNEDVTFPGTMMVILHNQGKFKEIKFQYKTDYFSKETINLLGARFIYLLENLVTDSQQLISELSILSKDEKERVLELIHSTNHTKNRYHNMKEVIETSLNIDSKAVALSGQNFYYTRQEVNQKANDLAHRILEQTGGKKVTIAIQVNRSPELVLAVLAVVKAGCSYLPIDPKYPASRKIFILEDSGVKLFLTDQVTNCPKVDGVKIYEMPSSDMLGEGENPDVQRSSEDLLYVEYTSGSTGRPKAVLITDDNAINALSDLERKYPLKEADVYCFKTAFSFDISGTELYGWIFGRGSLFILDEEAEKDAGIILNSIFEQKITHINFVPSMFRLFLENISSKNKHKLETLKWIFVGGESITHEVIQQYLALGITAQLENMYGPTECTIWSTTQSISEEVNNPYISIGKPLNNTRVYILDEQQNIQPIGLDGEICIAGIQVAKGYKNRSELNKQVFIKNPYYLKGDDLIYQKMYRTGDTGRLQSNGSIEYIQRMDHQVKIGGLRIELGEIESDLEKIEGVIQAVVVVKNLGSVQAKICAYYLGKKIERFKFQDELSKSLPNYMIPAVFVHLTEFPYTNSGKVDRKYLEQKQLEQLTSQEKKMLPQNELEQVIFQVWQEVLGKQIFGIDDKFVDIGGHSLAFIQVHNKLKKSLNQEFPITDLLEMPTIRLLAEKLGSHELSTVQDRKNFFKHKKNTLFSDIAIVGMSVNVPGSDNLGDFWKNLMAEKESIYFYTDDELREIGISEELINKKNYIKGKGRINHLDTFDSEFFEFSPSEVAKMSPQLKILYRGAWEAFEDAGHVPQDESLKTGVFVGGSDDFEWYKTLIDSKEHFGNIYERFTLSTNHFLATRLAYKFNITGPVFSALTGCSTTLVTTHLACQSLMLGECDVALAGGITVELPNEGGYLYEKGMMFSPDGHCRPFDQKAQGTVFSNGMGLVVLKRADEAYRDGDNIYAVIKGSAINNDGNQKIGFTAPSVKGQVNVIQDAYKRANIDPETISYVEAHGTGTALGDPIEVQSLNEAFASSKRQYCTLGSVKGNIGHTDTAAGVVGLIKTALVLNKRFIPATINFQKANQKIDFSQTPFQVNSKGRTVQSEEVFRAGVNSFGVGGTNAHMVLEESFIESKEFETQNNLFVISGKTEKAAKRNVERVLNYVNQTFETINLSHVAWTLQKGRLAFPYRYTLVVDRNSFVLEREIKKLGQASSSIQMCEKNQMLYFMFSGQGSQYQGMTRELFENKSGGKLGKVYQESVLRLLSFLTKDEGEQIKSIMFGTSNDDTINQTQYTQLSLFISEYSLAKTLLALGIKPDVLIGHSIGELVAATISGIWSVQNAMKIVKMRGELMQKQPASSMLAVLADFESIQHLLTENCYLALKNTTNKCVVGGETKEIEQLNQKLSELKINATILRTSHAFHTPIMKQAREAFYDFMKEIELSEPSVPIVSNLTGEYVTEGEMTTPEYWADHIVSPVCFEESLNQVLDNSSGIFIEIGPGNTLVSFLRQHKNYQKQIVTNTIRHSKELKKDEGFLLEKVGYLWKHGVTIDWDQLSEDKTKRKISLPTYSFEEILYPIEQIKEKEKPIAPALKHDSVAITSARHNLLDLVVTSYQEVFGFSNLSVEEDFFELGGDSLKATSLISILEEKTGINLEISDIFDHSKIKQLADILDQNFSPLMDNTTAILPAEVREYYPLSTAQKRMFALQMLERNTTSFNLSSVTFIHGNLDKAKVKTAIIKLINRHEILKTSFSFKDNDVVQQVMDDFEVPFEYQDNSIQQYTLQSIKDSKMLKREIDQFIRPFNMGKAPLLRAKLVQLNKSEQLLFFDVHHIVSDGTSMEIIAKEFNQFYFGNTLDKGLQYRDYAVWEKDNLLTEELLEQKRFWLEELAGPISVLQMPLDHERPKKKTFAGRRFYFTFDTKTSSEIKIFSQKTGVTIYMTMLCIWFVFLAKYSNQTDLVIGSPASGRSRKEVSDMVGMFINMLPIKLIVEPSKTPIELLSQVKDKVLNAFQNQDYPFDQLVEDLKVPRVTNRNAIFDICFDFQNMQQNELEVEGVQFSSYEMPIETTSYDLVITCKENNVGQIEGFIDYSTDLFEETTIREMIVSYKNILNQFMNTPDKAIHEIDLNRLSDSLSLMNVEDDSFESISDLFENKVATLRDKDALILPSGQKISFEMFDTKANILANKLYESGIVKGDVVGLLVDRDEYLMISMFAVLKLGAAYVPIDPDFPKERIEYMIEHSEAKFIVSKQKIFEKLLLKNEYIDYEKLSSEKQNRIPHAGRTIQVSEDSLAYIIYTSGTTGQPKGVMISQAAVINFIQDTKERKIFANEADKVFSLTTNSFDIFGFESIVALCLGHTVYIASKEEQLDARLAAQKIVEHQLTHILSTVSRIKAMVENNHFEPALNQLTCILSGGENYPISLMQYLQKNSRAKIYNMYGPSETTIWSTVKELTTSNEVTIGTPIKNTQVYILDSTGGMVSKGTFGEICISGSGVALGYKKNQEETEKRFVVLKVEDEVCVYKTGDCGRVLPNGEIELAGRLDEQVKIRGYRIELSEVEHHIQAHEIIDQAIVKVFENEAGIEYLVAFYTAKQTGLDVKQLKVWLVGQMPEYMLPTRFIQLTKFPQLPNGKIDKNELTIEAHENIEKNLKQSFVKNDRKLLAKEITIIWQEIFSSEYIRLEDNFFDIGGNSLGLMLVNNQLLEKLDIEVTLLDLFEHPTINSLLDFLTGDVELSPHFDSEEKQILDSNKEEIAIIAMAGRFPKSKNIQEYWQQLLSNEEMIHFFSEAELEKAGISKEIYKKENYVAAKGYLEGTEYFDSDFFNYSNKEATLMDPQVRSLHEIVWQSLEEAGYNPFNFKEKIGLFAGSSTNISWLSQFLTNQYDSVSGFELLTLNDKDFLTTKVSYKLNLKGPSINIQTACSTSLVAIHQAKESLLRGECKLAVAGGISITYPQKEGYLWYSGMIFSKDGHCRPFSADANGTISGNGSGVVVLKRLSDAKREGDTIVAVIKGSAVNNDGIQKVGYTAPSIAGQKTVIQSALKDAALAPEQIDYVETHGTGTELGDPIEFEALKQAYNTKKRNYCSLGSVKANIGHLDAAAGVAGFIKTVMLVKSKTIPPLTNFDRSNEKINLLNSPFRIDTTRRELSNKGEIYAGISSFGIGGTNAHIIIGSYNQESKSVKTDRSKVFSSAELLIFSGKTLNNLISNQQVILDYMNENREVSLAQIAQQLQKRAIFEHRGFQVVYEDGLERRLLPMENHSVLLHEDRLSIILLEEHLDSERIDNFFREQEENLFAEVYMNAIEEVTLTGEKLDTKRNATLDQWIVKYGICRSIQSLGIQGEFHGFSKELIALEKVLNGSYSLKKALLERKNDNSDYSVQETTTGIDKACLVLGSKNDSVLIEQKEVFMLDSQKDFAVAFYTMIGQLWANGYPINLNYLHAAYTENLILPSYEFSKIYFPNDIVLVSDKEQEESNNSTLLNKEQENKLSGQISEHLLSSWKEVLGTNIIHPSDDFFDLGGHSLAAIMLCSKIKESTGIEVNVSEIFDHTNFSELENYLQNKLTAQNDSSTRHNKIQRVEEKFYYDASYAQKRIYAVQEMEEDQVAYNLGAAYYLNKKVDFTRLQETFQELVNRHESFRTSFSIVDGELKQFIFPRITAKLERETISEKEIDSKISSAIQSFKLSEAPLIRMKLFTITDARHLLVIDMHHIISDQFSIQVLLKEFHSLYKGETLVPLALQYKDFTAWQNQYIASAAYSKDLAFWKQELSGDPAALVLPHDYPRSNMNERRSKNLVFHFSDDLNQKLVRYAKKETITPYMVIFSTIQLLFWKYSSQEDFVLGTAISGRTEGDLESIVGMFVNTLAIRTKINCSYTFKEHMEKTKRMLLQSFEHQNCQFDLLVEELGIKKDISRNPLFDIMINYINMGTDELQLDDEELEPYEMEQREAKFDLTCTIIEKNKQFSFEIEYDCSLFKELSVNLLGTRLLHVLETLLADPLKKLTDISIMTLEDCQLINEINKTATDAPFDQSIISLIESFVSKTPNKVALIYKEKKMTYAEIDKRANQLGNLLQKNGVKKGNRVAILLERGPLQIISILGIMKTGGIYVPIDTEFPPERISFMLKDSQASTCITNDDYHFLLPNDSMTILLNDEQKLNQESSEAISRANSNGQDDLYIIYTSGSTGKPKGVLVQNQNVIRVVCQTNYVDISSADVFLQLSNYAFDGSIFDIFGALLHGASLVLVDQEDILELEKLAIVIQREQVTSFFMTASLFNMFVDWKLDALKGLKILLIGGEALSVEHVEKALTVLGNGKLINGYGPTETTVFACCYKITDATGLISIPIGKPIANTSCYVLDPYQNILPIGVSGELCIGGAGVASGYINQPELTQEKFIHLRETDERVYKTGDIVIFDVNNVIHYLGRNDEQVKIRGFRIELGEIEYRIKAIPGISNSLVMTEKDAYGSTRLVLYYIIDSTSNLEKDAIIRAIQKILPAYMIPSDFIRVDYFPLTHNGKLDKRKLKQLAKDSNSANQAKIIVVEEEVEHDSEQKELVLAIMKKVLDYPELSMDDDFFNHGGESIKAISLAQELKSCGYRVRINEIFQYSTANELVKLPCFNKYRSLTKIDAQKIGSDDSALKELSEKYWTDISQQLRQQERRVIDKKIIKEFPLSPSQMLHLSLDYQETGFIHEHSGNEDVATLKETIWKIVERQQLLRTTLYREKKIWQEREAQTLKEDILKMIPVIDLSDINEPLLIASAIASQVLHQPYTMFGFLWRCVLIKFNEHDYQIIWGFHHLIFDGMSLEIIKKQFEQLLMNGNISSISSLNYSDYVKELEKLTIKVNEQEVIKHFSLKKWVKQTKTIIDKKNESSESWQIKLALNTLTDNVFNEALNAIKTKLEPLFEKNGATSLPMGMLQYGREFGRTQFFDSVGEFLDILPIQLSKKDKVNFDVMKQIEWTKKGQIHFLNLAMGEGKIGKLLKPIFKEKPLSMILLNFQGYIYAKDKEAYERFSEKISEKNQIAKQIIVVYFDEDYLYIEST